MRKHIITQQNMRSARVWMSQGVSHDHVMHMLDMFYKLYTCREQSGRVMYKDKYAAAWLEANKIRQAYIKEHGLCV
jgi:hypothetical protein